jgi:hypothetical protein
MNSTLDAWLTVDFVAKRYGVLPSQLLAKGWNTDIVCANLAVGYENYLRRRAESGQNQTPQPSVEEMQAMIARVNR